MQTSLIVLVDLIKVLLYDFNAGEAAIVEPLSQVGSGDTQNVEKEHIDYEGEDANNIMGQLRGMWIGFWLYLPLVPSPRQKHSGQRCVTFTEW